MREKVQATGAAETHIQAGFLVKGTGGCANPAKCKGTSPKARAPRSLSPWFFGAGKATQPWGYRAASARWKGRAHAQREAAIRRHQKLPSWPEEPLSPREPCPWTQVRASELSLRLHMLSSHSAPGLRIPPPSLGAAHRRPSPLRTAGRG